MGAPIMPPLIFLGGKGPWGKGKEIRQAFKKNIFKRAMVLKGEHLLSLLVAVV